MDMAFMLMMTVRKFFTGKVNYNPIVLPCRSCGKITASTETTDVKSWLAGALKAQQTYFVDQKITVAFLLFFFLHDIPDASLSLLSVNELTSNSFQTM